MFLFDGTGTTERTGPGLLLEDGEKIAAKNVATTSAAAVTNHFSWRRSSPTDPRNRTTTAASDAASAFTRGRKSSHPSRPLGDDWLNGCFHDWVETTTLAAVTSVKAPPTNHATGRHRGD